MRTATKGTLGVDFSLQVVSVGLMLITYVLGLLIPGFIALALLVQFIVGVVQVMSGLLHSIRFKDKVRQQYTAFALFYVLGLILGGSLLSDWGMLGFFVIFVVLIPVGIACWYCNLTYQDWKAAPTKVNGDVKHQYVGQEDVLDDIGWQ
ncbi:MAG: hypothetical protein GY810_03255 [Aureispira sp.]|nr:hypothetical protein [Aureispira sp.]